MKRKILLASGSPRRAYLLEELDMSFRVTVSNVAEIIPPGMPNGEVAEYLAILKGEACLDQLNEHELVLAADTVVIHRDEILGKPTDLHNASEILHRLSGEEHDVISGVFISDGIKRSSFSVKTRVVFDVLTKDEVDYYLLKYNPVDKAGSYGIQEWIGWSKISEINGSYSNIMGLPTREVYQAILAF